MGDRQNYPNYLAKDFQHDLFLNQLRVNSSAQNKYHDFINQERNWGDCEPNHRNFRPHPVEQNDDDTIGDDLTTSPKPEFDLENNKSYVGVQARDSVFPNRSEITTIVLEEASKAPPPSYHPVRSEKLAKRFLHKRQQQEISQANTNEITGSTPKSRDQEVQFSNKENKSVFVSPVSGCVEVNRRVRGLECIMGNRGKTERNSKVCKEVRNDEKYS